MVAFLAQLLFCEIQARHVVLLPAIVTRDDVLVALRLPAYADRGIYVVYPFHVFAIVVDDATLETSEGVDVLNFLFGQEHARKMEPFATTAAKDHVLCSVPFLIADAEVFLQSCERRVPILARYAHMRTIVNSNNLREPIFCCRFCFFSHWLPSKV